MDFEENCEDRRFARRLRAWLAARAKRRQPGTDPRALLSSSDTSAEADAATCARARPGSARSTRRAGRHRCRRSLAAGARAGWQQRISTRQVSLRRRRRAFRGSASRMAGPTIIAWGTPEQQERFPRPDAEWRARVCSCSRSRRGSDLAGLRTRATPDGEQWIVKRPEGGGRRVRTTATGDSFSPAPTSTHRAQGHHRGRVPPRMHTPGSRCGHCARSTGWRTSTRCSSPTWRFRRMPPRPGQRRLARCQHDALQRARHDRRRRPRRLARHRHTSRSAPAPTTIWCYVSSSRRAHAAAALKWLGWRARSRKDQGLGPEASVIKLAASGARSSTAASCWPSRRRPGCCTTATRSRTATGSNSSSCKWSSRIGGGYRSRFQRNVIGERGARSPGEPRVDKRRRVSATSPGPDSGAARAPTPRSAGRSVSRCSYTKANEPEAQVTRERVAQPDDDPDDRDAPHRSRRRSPTGGCFPKLAGVERAPPRDDRDDEAEDREPEFPTCRRGAGTGPCARDLGAGRPRHALRSAPTTIVSADAAHRLAPCSRCFI